MKIDEVVQADFFSEVVSFIIQQVPEAIEIWLHGSHATNTAKRGSDWDFLVIVPDDIPQERYLQLSVAGSPIDIGHIRGKKVDIQIARASDISRPGSVAYWAVQEGRRLR